VCVEVRELVVLRDGRPAPRDGLSEPVLPVLFRDSSEIRPRATPGATAGAGAAR